MRLSSSEFQRVFICYCLSIVRWTVFASGTLGGFVANTAYRSAGRDANRHSRRRLAAGESKRSTVWFSLTASMPKSSVDWFYYWFLRLAFARRSVTSRIQILMIAGGHKFAPEKWPQLTRGGALVTHRY